MYRNEFASMIFKRLYLNTKIYHIKHYHPILKKSLVTREAGMLTLFEHVVPLIYIYVFIVLVIYLLCLFYTCCLLYDLWRVQSE